jgi:glycosyltransferase involved in cell wall biosynthesis
MTKPDISVVINAHREGLIAVPTIRSLAQAKFFAERRGVLVETIVVLDRCDELTADVFADQSDLDCEILHVDNGDLGSSRNDGAIRARGEWIAYLDADDIWGENWLAGAFMAANADNRMVVWHPEANLYFGVANYIFRHVDMDTAEFEPLSLLINNYWTALCFTRRTTIIDIPYKKIDLSRGIGYEDWSWNQEVIARGGIHKIVRDTAHAIRARNHSLLRTTAASASIPYPCDMYRNILMRRTRTVLV